MTSKKAPTTRAPSSQKPGTPPARPSTRREVPPSATPKGRTAQAPAKVSAEGEALEQNDFIRLNVYLQEQGIASRRKSDTMIQQGRVQVDGVVVTQLGTKIPPHAEVKVDGRVLRPVGTKKTVLMLHKPDLCLTSRSDSQGRRTVFDLPALKKLPPGCQAVGRLDFRSEGLLLLTNDGDLAYALTHPRFSVEKTYAVLVANDVNAEDVDKLRKGVQLDDGFAKPVAVRLGNKERLGASRGQWVEIIVAEGRNRLIRRMMEVVGLNVIRLVRLAIGDLRLPEKLSPGHVAPVVGAELAYLNRIKLDMLQERDAPKTPPARPVLTEEEKLKRKLKRKLSLNDAEYAEERERRAAEAGSKKRLRREALEAVAEAPKPGAKPANRPHRPAKPSGTSSEKPQGKTQTTASESTARNGRGTSSPQASSSASSGSSASSARRKGSDSRSNTAPKSKTPRPRDVARRKPKQD